MRQEFTVEIATMNNATVLPLERGGLGKMISPDLMAETVHYRCHKRHLSPFTYPFDQILELQIVHKSKLGPQGTSSTEQALQV